MEYYVPILSELEKSSANEQLHTPRLLGVNSEYRASRQQNKSARLALVKIQENFAAFRMTLITFRHPDS